jgi:hypothetical protein
MSDTDRAQIVACEDLITFLSACSASSRRGAQDALSLDFLHAYIAHHHRRLYARCLAAGLTHHAQSLIITRLLALGAPADPDQRAEEGLLLIAALRALPPQRAYKALDALRARRINNRRARAIIRQFLVDHPRLDLHAVKYRRLLKSIIRHAHIPAQDLDPELGRFLFAPLQHTQPFSRALWESYRRACYSKAALYDLPFTVAEGLAARHHIPRKVFLREISSRMTANERLRTQSAARAAGADAPALDLATAPLTRLALYVLSLPFDERHARWSELEAALDASARRALARAPLQLGDARHIALVLDNSWSARGEGTLHRRPLAVALAVHHLVRQHAAQHGLRCSTHWTMPQASGPSTAARGQTNIARPLLDALANAPDLVLIVSDGAENDPPCGAHEVARLWWRDLDPKRHTRIIHLNPVFEASMLGARPLSPLIPTTGLRDAEDLPRAIALARFAASDLTLAELEAHLEACTRDLLAAAPATCD